MNATLTTQDIATLKSIRTLPQELATNLRAAMFSSFKHSFSIPQDHKVKVEVDDVGTPQYGVIVRKKNGKAYPLNPAGKWVDPDAAPVVATPREPAKRWFVVNKDDALNEIIGDNDFNGGLGKDDLPYDVVISESGDVAVDSDGDVWLLIPESAFE